MSNVETISAVLQLLAGLGVFLVACKTMSSNLESMGSSKLRQLFALASKSKLIGVGIGTVGAAAIQSSGATTVIAIGFLNAGIMSLVQAATVIFGANIGTTITGQIVAWGISGSQGVSTTVIFSALAGVGAFITSFASKDKVKTAGGIITGFGMLFVGLSMMSGAMGDFARLDSVRAFLASIGSPVLLVLIGAALTAIVQSSSVITSVSITMAVSGLISVDQGIYLTMGANIGACIVSVLAGLTGTANAKRAAFIDVVLNVGGAIIFVLPAYLMGAMSGGHLSYGAFFAAIFPGAVQIQLAMFHTAYAVLKVLIALPFTEALCGLVERIIADDAPIEGPAAAALQTYFIDESLLLTPAIAVEQVKNEILNMAQMAYDNFLTSLVIVTTLDFADREEFCRAKRRSTTSTASSRTTSPSSLAKTSVPPTVPICPRRCTPFPTWSALATTP